MAKENNRPAGPTPSQTVGPFFGFALPFAGDSLAAGPEDPDAVRVEGQVFDGAGEPVPDALLEFWQADQFARCGTDAEGAYSVVVAKPASGPAVDSRRQAPHLNVTVFARGLLRHLTTRLYFPDEAAANAEDPVLRLVGEPGARETLVAVQEPTGLRFDVRLQGDGETVFFAV